jgi:hypothetical protein
MANSYLDGLEAPEPNGHLMIVGCLIKNVYCFFMPKRDVFAENGNIFLDGFKQSDTMLL